MNGEVPAYTARFPGLSFLIARVLRSLSFLARSLGDFPAVADIVPGPCPFRAYPKISRTPAVSSSMSRWFCPPGFLDTQLGKTLVNLSFQLVKIRGMDLEISLLKHLVQTFERGNIVISPQEAILSFMATVVDTVSGKKSSIKCPVCR